MPPKARSTHAGHVDAVVKHVQDTLPRFVAMYNAEIGYYGDDPHVFDEWVSSAGMGWGDEAEALRALDDKLVGNMAAWGVTWQDMEKRASAELLASIAAADRLMQQRDAAREADLAPFKRAIQTP